MTDIDRHLWRVKLKAWTHDPAEKALVLFRDPAGHEGGSVRALRDHLALDDADFEARCDHWAAAADRPQFPREAGDRYAAWAQVRFAERPVLIHPLSGQEAKFGTLHDMEPEPLKAVSLDHLLTHLRDLGDDPRAQFLAAWRFGPEIDASEIKHLWRLLPADTRVPDHTIWAHLDLTAAFAGAFAGGGVPALLLVTFGPVQDFIAEARSTSDLWAGSHLLARIAWEGMKVIAERFGPDSILFPQLRGVPDVDLWLKDEINLPDGWFERAHWMQRPSEANPLFAAALPNRFVAIVPEADARALATEITERVRAFVRAKADEALGRVLNAVGEPEGRDERPCFAQLDRQLGGFPEVHWACVPWSLATEDGKAIADARLRAALGGFCPGGVAPGFFASDAYTALTQPIADEGVEFYRPNPGVLYPALYDLLDRTLAAAKSLRAFGSLTQEGYRAALGGEREWLTLDRSQLSMNPTERAAAKTLWTRLAEENPRWAGKGEHLDALGTLKRLWPDLTRDAIGATLGGDKVRRYVVSTRTFALAPYLEHIAGGPLRGHGADAFVDKVREHQGEAVLPRKLALKFSGNDETATFCRKLGAYLDDLGDKADGGEPEDARAAEDELAKAQASLRTLLGGVTPFPYYAIFQLDGDRMGAWLSGTDASLQTTYGQAWHRDVRRRVEGTAKRCKPLGDYLHAPRAPSPGRHMAISDALNAFALNLARPIVEDLHKGQLIYAGGDDVLAMVAVDDLLPCITLLRLAFSGVVPGGDGDAQDPVWKDHLSGAFGKNNEINRGFVLFNGVLHRVMGERATASVGAVVAHEKEPLARVLRVVRETEQRAKKSGRNAFALTLLKRSGGPVEVTAPWWLDQSDGLEASPIGRLLSLRALFTAPAFSRRALYHVLEWLHRLPTKKAVAEEGGAYQDLLSSNLVYQMRRQASSREIEVQAADEAAALIKVAAAVAEKTNRPVAGVIEDFLSAAEFLARPSRDLKIARDEPHPRQAAE
jgi:CRISPR-associated protein Cmr2